MYENWPKFPSHRIILGYQVSLHDLDQAGLTKVCTVLMGRDGTPEKEWCVQQSRWRHGWSCKACRKSQVPDYWQGVDHDVPPASLRMPWKKRCYSCFKKGKITILIIKWAMVHGITCGPHFRVDCSSQSPHQWSNHTLTHVNWYSFQFDTNRAISTSKLNPNKR